MSLRHAWVILLLAGCRPATPTEPVAPADPKAATTTATGPDGRPLPRAGAGHTANIDRVELSSDGTMAISRDQIGRVRAWTALDGSVEPVVVPVTGATTMSIEARGDAGEATVVVVESSGAAKILSVGVNGKVEETGALPPFAPLLGAWVVPGGERVLALFKDHTVRQLDRDAKELGRLEKRNFRPHRLELGVDGKSFVALGRHNAATTLQRGRIADDGGVDLLGESREILPGTAMTQSTGAASSDGERFGYIDKLVGNEWEVVSVDLVRPAAPERRFKVQLPSHVTPSLGFVGKRDLLVTGSDGSLSWLLDVDEGSRRPRSPAPQDFATQGRAQAMRAGVHASGYGTWLFVHDVTTQRHHYLGYRSSFAQGVAVSPSSRHVAWAYAQGPLLVESLDGKGAPREVDLDLEPNIGTTRVQFVDDETLLAADTMGGVHIVAWETGREIDDVGVTGGVRDMQFDSTTGLLLLERHYGDAQVYRYADGKLEGPWIVADGSFRRGLLSAGAPGHAKAVLWSLDNANKIRHYRLEHLRADLTHAEADDLGRPLAEGKVAPLAVDRTGRSYGVRWNGSTMELFADDGKDTKTIAAPAGDINQLIVAPDGSRFVAVHQRGQSTTLTAHDGKTLEEQWSYSTGTFNNSMVWSDDGRWLGIAANTGAVLLDAKTGKPRHMRCGVEFTAAGSAPQNAFNGLNLPSVCEP